MSTEKACGKYEAPDRDQPQDDGRERRWRIEPSEVADHLLEPASARSNGPA